MRRQQVGCDLQRLGRVVLGLETLRGPHILAEIANRIGPESSIVSVDLRAGRPVLAPGSAWGTDDPVCLARTAVDLGWRQLLLLDLARVGTGSGVGTLGLLERIRRAWPEVEVYAGGGVRGPECLVELANAGAAGILVGSALHDGRIGGRSPD